MLAETDRALVAVDRRPVLTTRGRQKQRNDAFGIASAVQTIGPVCHHRLQGQKLRLCCGQPRLLRLDLGDLAGQYLGQQVMVPLRQIGRHQLLDFVQGKAGALRHGDQAKDQFGVVGIQAIPVRKAVNRPQQPNSFVIADTRMSQPGAPGKLAYLHNEPGILFTHPSVLVAP